MNRGSGSTVVGLALPIKIWAQRFAFLLLIVSAFTLMLLSKAETVLIEQSRTAIVDAVAPVLTVLSQPAQSVSNAIEEVNGLFLLRADNARLKRENSLLLGWQNEARRLQMELTALRSQMNIVPDPIPRAVGARVIADSAGTFVHSMLINAGSNERLIRGQAAVTVDGLVGRVAAVGRRSARILLLTDLNSRVPVVIEASGDRAILAGNNSARPELLHLPRDTPVTPGDRILTSGHGGVFPPGLAVGIIAEVGETGISVQPLVDYGRLAYVQVLDYGPDGILPPPGAVAPEVAAPPSPTTVETAPVETAPDNADPIEAPAPSADLSPADDAAPTGTLPAAVVSSVQ